MEYGIKLDGLPAERIRELAPLIDQSGLDELWVVEDLGLAGGIAQAATLLADTSNVRVGIGITPAVARNPAYLAMEIATLSRMHPGRFMPGIGHGMPHWLEQVGARPANLLTALEEVASAVKQLLSGQSVSLHGQHVHLDQVTLTHPPLSPPPISLGVRGPKGVALSSRVADGIILAEGSGPEYVRQVRNAIGPDNRLTVFVWLCLLPDRATALRQLRPVVAKALASDFMKFQLGGRADAPADDAVVLEIAVAGDAASCAEQIKHFREAGVDSLVFAPLPGEEEKQLKAIRDELLPSSPR
jgi:alkanesulfonate monooxygenase SsuD/methylene tetrahydromethanopterin reductase-like flavin-dependent oxidoreductase (luciferase family)